MSILHSEVPGKAGDLPWEPSGDSNCRNSSPPIVFSVISTKGRNLLAWNCVLSDQDFSHSFEMTTWAELLQIAFDDMKGP